MNKQTSRDIFDNISMNVISFLENHIGICDVEYIERSGVSEMSVSKWEEENAPFNLPEDLKAFLQISDGLSLTWRIKRQESHVPLGCMNLNKLRDIKKIKGESFKFDRIGGIDNEEDSDNEIDQKDTHGFDIDSETPNGRLCLLYKGTTDKPQVWFQDLSCNWFYIADSFTDYFRLMIMHLGIPHWQYVFTKAGLDQCTLQWFRFFIPDRLAIDIENRKNLEYMNSKKGTKVPASYNQFEALKRKRRRTKLKAKDNEQIIEKFCAQSSKQVKYAKSVIKKRETSELLRPEGASTADAASIAGGNVTVTSQNDNTDGTKNII